MSSAAESKNVPEENYNIFGKIVYSKFVQAFIVFCIVLNAVQLGLDTSAWWIRTAGPFSKILDAIFIWIFAVEIVLKLLSDKHRFFKSGWNVFDFLIVAISFAPGNGVFSVLRVFRIFRALRLLYRIPRLMVITESLLRSIPSIGWICVLLAIWFYIFSVIATNLFGAQFTEWFGTIPKSMYSLFQIMTLESWSMGIVRPVMKAFPYAWLLFVPFIIFATYTVMNLFIGIMVNSISEFQDAREAEKKQGEEKEDPVAQMLAEVHSLRQEIRTLSEENAAMKKSIEGFLNEQKK